MKILSGSNIDREAWAALVAASATGTWFQSPEAYEFYALQPKLFNPFAIGLESGSVLRAVCVGYITIEKSPHKGVYID